MDNNFMAAKELFRISKIISYHVHGITYKRQLNHHSMEYIFEDGSIMQTNKQTKKGKAWASDKKDYMVEVTLTIGTY